MFYEAPLNWVQGTVLFGTPHPRTAVFDETPRVSNHTNTNFEQSRPAPAPSVADHTIALGSRKGGEPSKLSKSSIATVDGSFGNHEKPYFPNIGTMKGSSEVK